MMEPEQYISSKNVEKINLFRMNIKAGLYYLEVVKEMCR